MNKREVSIQILMYLSCIRREAFEPEEFVFEEFPNRKFIRNLSQWRTHSLICIEYVFRSKNSSEWAVLQNDSLRLVNFNLRLHGAAKKGTSFARWRMRWWKVGNDIGKRKLRAARVLQILCHFVFRAARAFD